MDKSSIGDRMKQYETVSDAVLMGRVPVAIRIDGKGFSTLTKRLDLDKPFDGQFRKLLDGVMLAMCKEIQGCVVGYAHSQRPIVECTALFWQSDPKDCERLSRDGVGDFYSGSPAEPHGDRECGLWHL